MHNGRDNRSNVRRSVLSCTLLVATVATLIAGSAQMGTYAEAATPVTLQSVGLESLTGGYPLLSSRLDVIGASKKSGAKRKGVSIGGLQLFQASEDNTNEITFVEEPSVDGGYVEEFHGDGTYIEEFHGDGSQADAGGSNDNVVVIGDGGAGDGVEVVTPDEVVVPEEHKEEHASDGQTHEWPVTRTQTVSDSEGTSYTVTVTFGEDAGIPHEAELKVSTSDATESRVSSQRAAISLGSDEFAVADWFLDVTLERDGQVCVPTGTVEVVVDTDAIDPSLSDAVEVAVSSSAQASENRSGSAAKGHSSFKFGTDKLGEIGLTAVVRKSCEVKVLDSTIAVWAPRSASVKAKESFDIPDALPSEGIAKIGTLKLSVDPSRSWPTNLYVTSERSSHSSLEDGLILSVEGEDTSLFGIEGTEEPVAVSDEGTYLVEWDTGCRDATVNSGDIEVTGPLPIGVEFEATDVRADYSDAESVTGVSDGVKYDYDVIGAYGLSFSVHDGEWTPDKVHKQLVTVGNIPVGPDHDVQVWHLEDDGFQQVEEVAFTDEGVSFFAADDGTYVLVDKVSLERVFTATDDETYCMTVTYDGSAGMPRDVYLEVSSLAAEGPEYLMTMIESAKSLGSAAKHIAYAQLFDIALVDPFTGVRHRPSEGVTIEVELLSAEVGAEDSLGVVNLGSDAIPVASATDGPTVDFDADGATTYAVVVTAVEKTVTASDGRTYEITVTYDSASGIPANAGLEVTEIVEGDEGYDDYMAASAEASNISKDDVTVARAFDISLIDSETGEVFQPTKEVTVSIRLLDERMDDNASADVVHFPSDGGEAQVLDSSIEDGAVAFGTDGFSVFVVVYTVDFQFGDYTYCIADEGEVALSTLLEELGVGEIALSDITDVSFSNPEYVEIQRQDSDWLLTSLKSFDTQETLTLTLSNETTVDIAVTYTENEVVPTAIEGLVYSGEEQELVNAVSVTEGTIVYSLAEDSDYSETIPVGTDAGTYTVYYQVRNGEGSVLATGSVDAQIGYAEVTVTPDDAEKVYGNVEPTLSATVTGLFGEDSVTYSLSRVEGQTAGDYDITATGDEIQGNYAVTYATGAFTVTPRPLTIIADSAEKPYDRTPLTKNEYMWVGRLVSGDVIDSVTVEGSQTEVGTGTNEARDAKIVNGQGEDVTSSYAIEYEAGTLEVLPKNVFVTANNLTKEYGDDEELTARISGLLQGDEESLVTYTISRAEGEDIGTHTITPTGEELQGYYKVLYRTATLTITPATATVRVENLEKVAGEEDPGFTATVTGLKGDDTEDAITYTLSRPDNNEDNPGREKSGEHDIVATGEQTQGNYVVVFENGVLTINKLTITFKNGEDEVRTSRLELNQSLGESDLVGVDKEGCDFKGWYSEDSTEEVTTETSFSEDTDLFAHFTVTVSFEAEGVDNPPAVVLDEGEAIGEELPEVSREGYRFDGWYLNPEFSGDKVTATDAFDAHTTLYAKFDKLIKVDFVVETVDGEGSATEEIEGSVFVDKGASLDVDDYPELTIPEGYALKGFFVGDAQIDAEGADYRFNADATVTARVVLQTTITYLAEGDDGNYYQYAVDTGDVNRRVSFPTNPRLPVDATLPETAKFKGWYEGNTRVKNNFTAATDRELTARYTVTVTFFVKNADYSSITSETPVTIDKGAVIGNKLLNDPVLAGYEFKGWYLARENGEPGDTKVTATTVFNNHANVVAKFTRRVSVVFETNGTRHEYQVDTGDTIALLENPVKANARFDGWFKKESGERMTNAAGITDADGNLIDVDGNRLPEGAAAVRELKVTDDLTLVARFIDQIMVDFVVVHPETRSTSTGYPSVNSEAKFTHDKTDEGVPVDPAFYDHIPNVSGYYFLGWYHINKVSDNPADYNPSYGSTRFVIPNSTVDGKVFELGDPAYVRGETSEYPLFTDNTTLAAKFAKEVTITFRYEKESAAGQEATNEVVIRDRCLAGKLLSEYYLPLELPADPLHPERPSAYREGCRIEWYRGGEKVEQGYVIVADDDNAVFDARYIQRVTATFRDENGNPIEDVDGNQIKPIARDKDTALGDLPEVPETIGEGNQQRRFMGWFDDAGKEYAADTILMADVTLKAKYGYKVTFTLDGDDTWESERYVASGAPLGWLPSAPFRAGYNFRNWTLGGAVVDVTHVVNQNETIVGHYNDVTIFTATINYTVFRNGALEPDPTDTKILTVDTGAVTEEAPVDVPSPTSFSKPDGIYYPVMQKVQLVPDDDTVLGVKDKHEAVTVEADPGNAQGVIITVPYKQADAHYTVRYMLKHIHGNAYDDIASTSDNPNPVHLEGVKGSSVYPEVREYDFADFEHSESGVIQHTNGNEFKVYYTRKNFMDISPFW